MLLLTISYNLMMMNSLKIREHLYSLTPKTAPIYIMKMVNLSMKDND